MDQLTALDARPSRVRASSPRGRSRRLGPTHAVRGLDVRDLVVHVLVGQRMAALLVGGGSREDAEALFDGADAPRRRARRVRRRRRRPGRGVRRGRRDGPDHARTRPATSPAAVLLGLRIADATMHTWDLARAIGADETLSADLVEHVWASVEPIAPVLAASGRFGEGRERCGRRRRRRCRPRLLDATGRRP